FFFSSRRRHTRSKRDWSSDVCSSDLDWDAKQAEVDQNRGLNRQSYDQVHGAGSFDRKKRQECEELHQKIVELDRQAEQNKQPTPVAGYDAWSDEDKAWYDDLVEGVMHLIDEEIGRAH